MKDFPLFPEACPECGSKDFTTHQRFIYLKISSDGECWDQAILQEWIDRYYECLGCGWYSEQEYNPDVDLHELGMVRPKA